MEINARVAVLEIRGREATFDIAEIRRPKLLDGLGGRCAGAYQKCRRWEMTRSTAAIALATLLAAWAVPVSAQRGGNTWKPLIPGLRTQFAAKSDPEMGTRLALVYAHEGMIYDGYRVLRQVDQAIGGAQGGSAADTNRAAFARRVSARASAEVGQDPGNLLARYELAFGSWFLETDHHTAMREMLEINRQDPRNAMNHGFLGYVYAERKDAPNTIAQWEEATRLDPSNSLLHYMLGLAYSHVGRSRDAALQFAQAYRDRTLYNYITRGEQP
jgi:tetratricopeptide (TPR) repeat protein